jgi:hypothetical protein
MRFILVFLMASFGMTAMAQNNCDKWSHRPQYIEAIKAVAQAENYDFAELCTAPGILDIEAQPSHTVTREGEVIPHVQVQLHMNYKSCLYMVRNADLAITSHRCYSGW